MTLFETLDPSLSSDRGLGGRGAPQRGVVLLFTEGRPCLVPLPLVAGSVVIGRDDVGGAPLSDGRVSRKHAEVRWSNAWQVRDLKSRNGTFADGQALIGEAWVDVRRVVRIGHSLFGVCEDVRDLTRGAVDVRDGRVVGPTLRACWQDIARAASIGDALHVTGQSGAGKELAARHFHDSGKRAKGPFVAVNCATIPANLAERLLFGARKGAFSGADADVEGHVQAADGGTLFLDEIAELDLAVQAKLLRVLETREVLPLGAQKGRKVDFAVCSATHQELRALAGAGRFRQDLFFRIGRPAVALPTLAERLEDVAYLVQAALGAATAHVSLVEECLLRAWPGNVRELLAEVRGAAAQAAALGSSSVKAEHLDANAGRALGEADPMATLPATPAARAAVPRERILEALRAQGGNVTRAARVLGWHRNQLRRWIDKEGVDPKLFDDT